MKSSDSNKNKNSKKGTPKKEEEDIDAKEIDGFIEKMNSENDALKKLLKEINKGLNNKNK